MSKRSSRFVRASKYRNIFSEEEKRDDWWTGVSSRGISQDGNGMAVSAKFIAVCQSSTTVTVMTHEGSGNSAEAPMVDGHAGGAKDVAFSPHNDCLLASAGEDSTVKLWSLPEEGFEGTMSDEAQTLAGHSKSVLRIVWNPAVGNVLASTGRDKTVKIWDVEKGTANLTIESESLDNALVPSMSWDACGKLLATSSKGKSTRLHDPRASSVVEEFKPMSGPQTCKVSFLGERGQLLTLGFEKQSKRALKIWDLKSLKEPIATVQLGQAGAVMSPFFDAESGLLFASSKGEGRIACFEVVDTAPFLHAILGKNQYSTSASITSVALMPKRAVDVLKCEIDRFVCLTASGNLYHVSTIVPRKESGFIAELYPDALSAEPSISADAWFSGGNVDAPKRVSMEPSEAAVAAAAAKSSFNPTTPPPTAGAGSGGAAGAGAGGAPGGEGVAKPAVAESATTSKPSYEELEKQLAEALERIKELELENGKLKGAPVS